MTAGEIGRREYEGVRETTARCESVGKVSKNKPAQKLNLFMFLYSLYKVISTFEERSVNLQADNQ